MNRNKSICITLPQPCNEDWHAMTPTERGRFCNSCQKCVIDFTGYTDSELYQFFTRQNDGNICGRFLNTQLNRQIQAPPHATLHQLYKWAMAAGLTLLLTTVTDVPVFAQAPLKTEQVSKQSAQPLYGYVYGVVTDRYGNTVPGVKVTLLTDDSTHISSISDAYGNYRLNGTPNGELTILFERDGYQSSKLISVPVYGRNAQLYVPFRLPEARDNGAEDGYKLYSYRKLFGKKTEFYRESTTMGPPPFPNIHRKH